MDTLETSFKRATDARENAYAPYSRFRVGAALHLPETDEVITGCNVENASFGATVCAERIAIFTTIAKYGSVPADHLVIVTDAEPPAPPCALCLQVLSEFFPPEFPIHIANLKGIQTTTTLGDLLPLRFTEFAPE